MSEDGWNKSETYTHTHPPTIEVLRASERALSLCVYVPQLSKVALQQSLPSAFAGEQSGDSTLSANSARQTWPARGEERAQAAHTPHVLRGGAGGGHNMY